MKTSMQKSGVTSKRQPTLPEEITQLLLATPKQPFPHDLTPMMATLTDKPFDDPDWVYEVKWDGYRAVCYLNKGAVELQSRNNKPFTERFFPIAEALQKLKWNAVLDGEIIVLDSKGRSQFGALQNWRSDADGQLVLYVFDLLWFEGKNLMGLPLTERQAILHAVLPAADDMIRLGDSFAAKGTEFFAAAAKLGLEGIMAKRADSIYTPGARTRDWLKIKVNKRQEVVIGGFTRNEGTSKQFSSLLLGLYQNGKLHYAGKVGTGFNEKMQREMMQQFKPLIMDKCPFDMEPDVNKPSRFRPDPPHAKATWLKPVLVGEISFTEVTSDGMFRHPSFEGIRDDKKATSVLKEVAVSSDAVSGKKAARKKS